MLKSFIFNKQKSDVILMNVLKLHQKIKKSRSQRFIVGMKYEDKKCQE